MMSDADELSADTVLRRSRNLRLEVDSHNIVQVRRHGGTIECGPRGLSILDVFHRPTTLSEALDRLEARGAQDWMDLTSVIVGLYRAGVLKETSSAAEAPPATDGGFADPMTHAIMLNDRARTLGFIEAIDEVVQDGDTVVDIGTGTGVLAIAAARAGARRVYAIESGDIGRLADSIFRDNGVDDRVILLQGWSAQLEVPELSDVLITETIGEIPLGEQILEVALDARRRWLKPEARLIPRRLRIYGLPVSIPAALLASRVVTGDTVQRWRSWYGVDFGSMAKVASGSSHVMFVDPETARDLTRLSARALLGDIDLATFDRLQVQGGEELRADISGDMNGVAVYFEVDLAPSVSLSTDPLSTSLESSWRVPVWFYNEPLSVREGDRLSVSFSYRVPGRSDGVTIGRPDPAQDGP